MNHPIFMQEVYPVEYLQHKPADEVQRKAIVAVTLDEFIQVDGHQPKRHALDHKYLTMRCLNGK